MADQPGYFLLPAATVQYCEQATPPSASIRAKSCPHKLCLRCDSVDCRCCPASSDNHMLLRIQISCGNGGRKAVTSQLLRIEVMILKTSTLGLGGKPLYHH